MQSLHTCARQNKDFLAVPPCTSLGGRAPGPLLALAWLCTHPLGGTLSAAMTHAQSTAPRLTGSCTHAIANSVFYQPKQKHNLPGHFP